MLVNRVFTEINFEDEVITFQCNATWSMKNALDYHNCCFLIMITIICGKKTYVCWENICEISI
jgi:hypothetical protein